MWLQCIERIEIYRMLKFIFKFKWTELREIETRMNLSRDEKKKKMRKFNKKKKRWCDRRGTNPVRSWWCRRHGCVAEECEMDTEILCLKHVRVCMTLINLFFVLILFWKYNMKRLAINTLNTFLYKTILNAIETASL
jgi:hypothetical protein